MQNVYRLRDAYEATKMNLVALTWRSITFASDSGIIRRFSGGSTVTIMSPGQTPLKFKVAGGAAQQIRLIPAVRQGVLALPKIDDFRQNELERRYFQPLHPKVRAPPLRFYVMRLSCPARHTVDIYRIWIYNLYDSVIRISWFARPICDDRLEIGLKRNP